MTEPHTFDQFADLIREGCVPVHGLRILSYLTPEGDLGYRWADHGDPLINESFGLIETVKYRMAFKTLT